MTNFHIHHMQIFMFRFRGHIKSWNVGSNKCIFYPNGDEIKLQINNIYSQTVTHMTDLFYRAECNEGQHHHDQDQDRDFGWVETFDVTEVSWAPFSGHKIFPQILILNIPATATLWLCWIWPQCKTFLRQSRFSSVRTWYNTIMMYQLTKWFLNDFIYPYFKHLRLSVCSMFVSLY